MRDADLGWLLLLLQVELSPVVVLQIVASDVHAFCLSHQLLQNGEHVLDLGNFELVEVLLVHSVLLEFDLELSEDASEGLVFGFDVEYFFLQLFVFALHFAVDLVYLFKRVLLGLLLVCS